MGMHGVVCCIDSWAVLPGSSPGSFGSLTYGLDIFHRVQSNVLVFMFQFINEHGDGVQVGLVFLCSSHCTMCCLWRPGDVLCR